MGYQAEKWSRIDRQTDRQTSLSQCSAAVPGPGINAELCTHNNVKLSVEVDEYTVLKTHVSAVNSIIHDVHPAFECRLQHHRRHQPITTHDNSLTRQSYMADYAPLGVQLTISTYLLVFFVDKNLV